MKLFQRILATALTLALLLGLLPAQAAAVTEAQAAAVAPTEKPTTLHTGSGETVEVDDEWETKYPYGAFVFAACDATLAEGGDALTVPVYRIGGVTGRATVYILFNPISTTLDEAGTTGSGSAAGFDDLTIETEDALPIARYQALGKDPDPEPGAAGIDSAAYTGEGAEEGDLNLTLNTAAESWQWQVLYNGAWQRIEDGAEDHLVIGAADLDIYDFRCVYTVGGARYCSTSLRNEAYEKPAPEVLEPAPEDIDLAPEQSFSPVRSTGDDPTAPAVFELTFADGEWVKYLRLTATEDDLAEPTEFASFTMLANEGGELFQSAGTLILSVLDNDDPEPFALGFELTEIEADKADGTATLTVVRSGGGQTPVTVSYATADGTALAGRDYEAVSGELFFYADYDRQTIEIPLIDDGAADAASRVFTVTLGEIRGDGAGLGSLEDTTATVQLTNSGTAERRNLATVLAVTNRAPEAEGAAMLRGAKSAGSDYDIAADASASAVIGGMLQAGSSGPIGGTQVTTEGSKLMQGSFTLTAPKNEEQLQSYQYGEITFSASGGQYWSGYAYVAGVSGNDYTGWSGGGADGSGWIYRSTEAGSATLNIPHMSQYFSEFYGRAEFKPEWASTWDRIWHGNEEYLYGTVRIQEETTSCLNPSGCSSTNISYYSSLGLYKELKMDNRSYNSIALNLVKKDSCGSDDPAWTRLVTGYLVRRSFENKLKLTIHTANDGERGGGNVHTAPAGMAELKANTGVYDSMKPVVTVVPNAGGINGSGKLYVGSQIKVSLQNTASYFPYSGDALNVAVYLTRSDGTVVNAKVEPSGNDYFITLFWDTLGEADLNDTYTINVVMTRKQAVHLDLSPSVDRRTDRDGKPTAEINTEKVPEALNRFWSSGSNYITVGLSAATTAQPHFSDSIETKLYYSLDGKSNDPLKTLGTLENVQYINFNRSKDDFIVFHGKAYAGNADIVLDVADLASAELTFLYYNKDYIASESVMTAAVESVAIYWDGNCNGAIDGHYDTVTGYFTLDEASGDSLYFYMDKDDSLCETFFQPTKDERGTHEFIAKIFYTMTPRSYNNPAGDTGAAAQVLPALITTVTDPAHYGALTEAQQSYRYLRSGQRADSSYTSDGHPMYGPAATAVQYVDVPLGGDYRPAGDDGSGRMAWTPDYRGHLLTDFADPEPIILEHSLMGDNYPLSDFSYNSASGTVTASNKTLLNGYLGAFVGNSTIALCPMEQTYATPQLASHPDSLAPESSTLIARSVYADPGDSTAVSTDPGNQPDAGFAEMSDNPFPEFGLSANLHNSGFNASFPAYLGLASFIYTKDAIQVVFSIPLVSWVKGKGVSGGPDFAGFKDLWNQYKQVKEAVDTFDGNALRSALETQNGDQAEGGSLRSGYFYVSLAFTGTVTFKYDSIDNAFVLDNFGVGVVGGLYFRVQQRFTPFPLAYVFFTLSFEVTVIARFENMQTKILSDWPIAAQDEPMALDTGETLEFDTVYVFMELAFRGKVYIEAVDPISGQPLASGKKGYLHGTGDDKLIKLATDPGPRYDGERTVRIRITALEPTVISHAQTVRKFTRELRFAGLGVDPKLSLSGGVGIGITLVKIEAFLNLTVSAAMSFIPYNQKTGTRETFQFEQVSISVGVGVNISAIAFNFSFKPIEIVFTYDGIKGEWKEPTWKSAFAPSNSLSAGTGPELPEDFSGASPNSPNRLLASANEANNQNTELFQAALTAYNTGAPFQVSGYSGSVSAFTLIDGLASGYDYKVVTAGGENYVLYTVGRRNAGALDRSMLVLSRLVATGSAPGLVNPLDAADSTPYIVVDDDASGDLEWAAWADGNQIRIAWVSYGAAAQTLQSGNLGAAALFRSAAQNRVVKTAVFNTTQGIVNGSRELIGSAGDIVFLPAAAGNAVAFVEADPMTEAQRADARAKYAAALTAAGYNPYGTGGNADVGAYRLQTQEALWDISGGVNRLTLWRSWAEPVRSELAPGVTVDNLQFTQIGGDFYLAFSTTEQVFLTADGLEALTADEVADMATVRRLCLKRIGLDGEKGTTYVLRTVCDRERDGAGLLQGGLFAGTAEDANDPGFANLRFLNAKLGSALGGTARNTAESFLLFEMCGNTYVVREDDLLSLAAGGTGSIRPFFTVNNAQNVTGATGFVGVTGVTGVTIGADGDGGLAAVYIAPVPGTTNNAVYLRQYDVALGWGDGVMLAMNHMDVYEQSIREGWDEETASKAYIDERADSFRFGSLQIALGTRSNVTAAGSGEQNKPDSVSEHDTTLLVLCQGTYDLLKQSVTGSGRYYPDPDGNPNRTGVYAISYGVGHQALGEASISFAGADFSAGALEHTVVKFKNTGDVAIRGSKNEPITVRLVAEGDLLDSTILAEWTVTDSVLPGREVSLNGEFVLPVTLPTGTKLNLSVSEDAGYTDKPYSAVLQNLLTIKSVPELGFADGIKLTPVQSTTSGSAVFDVDFTIENRGNEYAYDILLQFSYNTGEVDENGKPVYRPIDISGNTLTVSDQAPLQLEAGNPYRGLFNVSPISAGYGRRVTGTLTLPEKYFNTLRDGMAEVRVEIFSAADKEKYYQDNMLYAKVREEYNTANNVAETGAAHATFFYVPERLSIPLGVTLRLPLRYTCTDSEPSHILVAEFPQTETAGAVRLNSSSRFQHMDQRISELYYEENAYTNGTGVGTVVITPMEEGVSYVRIMDLETNDFVDIACEVTPGEGLNVFSGATDAGLFSFRNADGSTYSPGGAGQSWDFASNVAAWGADGSVPYKQDLAQARPGASFLRTETVAESMKLVFNGTVRVESTLPGFEPVTLTAKGGTGRNASEAAVVVFGNNARMIPHTVTITVVSPAAGKQYAEIDWLAEYYHGDSPLTLADGRGPQLYWSSSFPQKGTAKEPVSLTLHAVDDRALNDLWVEAGDVATAGAVTKDGENHWSLPLTFRQNGTLTLHVRDSAGNHAITELEVDWFRTGMTSGAPAVNIGTGWLSSSVKLLRSGADGADAGEEVRHLMVAPAADAPENMEIAVAYLGTDENGALDEQSIRETPGTAGAYPAPQDGLYLVKAVVTGQESNDPEYAYRILRSDGSVKEQGNGATVSVWTAEIVRVEDSAPAAPAETPAASPAPYTPVDGSAETVERTVGVDGTVAEARYNSARRLTGVKITVSSEALETALETDAVMPAPVTVPAGSSGAADAPVIRVELPAVGDDVPAGQMPRLAIPVTGADETTVAFIRGADGSWTPVKDCYVEDGRLIVPVESSCELMIAGNAKRFPDVAEDAWYAPYVDFVAARGIFNGTDRGFEPEGTMTRAMVAQVLYNLDRRSAPGIHADFNDVAEDAWYADAVGWAAGESIILGYDGAFWPDAPISRQDLVTILYRYAKAAGYPIAAPADYSGFADAGDVADYAREAMGWAVAVGMISGMGDGTLAPGGTATRAQVAKIMQVFLSALR